MDRSTKIHIISSYMYIGIPIILFFATWLRIYYAIPVVLIIFMGLFFSCKNILNVREISNSKKNKNILAAFLIIIFMVFFSGIGKLSYQNLDHYWRNGVLETLIQYSWPVYEINSENNVISLVYYIGFWLPAALLGKVWGVTVGHIFMIVWTIIGIYLFYSLVCSYLKKKSVWPLVLFFLFSGLDIVESFIKGTMFYEFSHIEWAFRTFQFSSFTTQLFWVFNQAVPAWIITMLVLLQRNNRNIVFLLSLSIIFSTLPFVGMAIIATVLIFNRKYNTKSKWKSWFKDTFTFENIVCGGVVGIISALYVFSNSRAIDSGSQFNNGVVGFVWQHYDSFYEFLSNYVMFLILEVGIFFILNYKYHKSNSLYYVALISLSIIPLITIGISYDFCMRASIPALVLLYLMTYQTFEKALKTNDTIIAIFLMICLIFGSRTPINEIFRSLYNTSQSVTATETCKLLLIEEKNFVASIENSFFYKYLAKPFEE